MRRGRRGWGPARLLALLALVAAGLLLPAAGPARSLDERFAACLGCHGADGQSRVPETPSLGGQPAFFPVAQLFLFREGRRDSPAMVEAARGLTNDDLLAFADRIARLPPPPPPATPPDPARPMRPR